MAVPTPMLGGVLPCPGVGGGGGVDKGPVLSTACDCVQDGDPYTRRPSSSQALSQESSGMSLDTSKSSSSNKSSYALLAILPCYSFLRQRFLRMNQILKVGLIICFHDGPHLTHGHTLCDLLHGCVIRLVWIHPTQPSFTNEKESPKPRHLTPQHLETDDIARTLPLLTSDSGRVDRPCWSDADPRAGNQKGGPSPF